MFLHHPAKCFRRAQVSALAITDSRIVDEVDLHDVLRIERQHLLLAHYDPIDSQLDLAPVVNSRDGMVDMVDAKIGERELLEDAEAIVSCFS